jgi:hypothetical protein
LICVKLSLWWYVVSPIGGKLVLWLQHIGAVEVLKNKADGEPVIWISDSASIVCFGNHVSESFPRDAFIMVQEHLKLSLRNGQIGVTELVRDVPAKGSELSSLQKDCVEEAKSPHERLVSCWFGAVFKITGVDTQIGSQNVTLKTLWRFNGGFDTVLKNGDGELVTRHRGQPDSEIAGCIV